MWLNGPTQWEDHKIGKKHKKNVKKGGPSKTPASSKAKANAKGLSNQPPEEAAGESPEAEEAKTQPAAMEHVNQQYGHPGGWPPPQYGYPGYSWQPPQYANPGYSWQPPQYCYPGYSWQPPIDWVPGSDYYPVPPPPDTSAEAQSLQ